MRRLIASLLLLAGFLCGASAQHNAMFVYRNDGVINAFLKSDVDSLVCSQIDVDSLLHSDYVVQEIWTADSVYRIPLENIDSISFVTFHLCPDHNHPHAIDLGLPSGTKWACCNVGASSPEGYGGYYAWGEMAGKNYYFDDNYAYYNRDLWEWVRLGSDISGTVYDVAHMLWDGSWVMPSRGCIGELLEYCTLEWTSVDGVNGMLVTGPSGGQIFLPAAGYRWGFDLRDAGSGCHCWASTQDPDYSSCAYYLSFFSCYWIRGWDCRCFGRSVRAVCP